MSVWLMVNTQYLLFVAHFLKDYSTWYSQAILTPCHFGWAAKAKQYYRKFMKVTSQRQLV